MVALVDSLKLVGQQESALVVPYDGEVGKLYMIVDGERRWQGCLTAGIPTYLAVVCDDPADRRILFALSVMKNFHRQTHTPMEKALAFEQFRKDGLTQTQISALVGENQVNVSRFLRLTNLVPEVRALVALKAGEESKTTDKLVTDVAIAISDLPPESQMKAALLVKGLSVAMAVVQIRKMAKELGVQRRTRKQKPSTAFRVLTERLDRHLEMLEISLEHDQAGFVSTLRARTPGERLGTREKLLKIAKRAEKLAGLVPKD